ncbi:glycosyl transferase [Hydrocarboniphaga effusa]|uniref:glycosyl transferase n=1 Tax=Hydrocarboniphaga effusa TaxID=243629 RepID=UPI003137C404
MSSRPDSSSVMRIFVGCDPNDCDLEQMMVLEHSLRAHASLPIELHWMRLSRDPESLWYSNPETGAGWRTERWATPFSGFRWAVPAACGYRGRALYMDADTLVLSDIARLWNAPLHGEAIAIARPQAGFLRFCVSLWDCERAERHLPSLERLRADPQAHADCLRYFKQHPELIEPIDPAFNNIDGENQPVERIAILHYSDMGTQFSHRLAVPRVASEGRRHWFDGDILPHPRQDLAALFDQRYKDAMDSGRSLDEYRGASRFGDFPKKSERHYAGNPITRSTMGRLWRRWRFGI